MARPPPPPDDWDLADARGEALPRPVYAHVAHGWEPLAPLDPTRAAEARARLEERLSALRRKLGFLQREDQARADAPRPQFGKRIGDHTADALEVRRNVITADGLRLQRTEARRALAKLDDGTYGRCDVCAGPIGDERLAAIPWAAECVACRSKRGRR